MSSNVGDSTAAFGLCRAWSFVVTVVGAGVLALVMVTAGTGCGGGETGQDPSADAGPDTGAGPDTNAGVDADAGTPTDSGDEGEHGGLDQTLGPDGVAVTEAAVFVSPEHGGVDRIVAVQSSEVSGVTDETPLPPEAQHVGDFTIEVSAGRNVDISAQEQGLYMIVPVPSSFEGEPSELAVATRLPVDLAQRHGDQLDSSIEHVWDVHPGYYIPKANAFAFPLHYLTAEGSEFALVRSEEYDSSTLEFPERDFGSSGQDESREQGLYRTKGRPVIHKTKVGKAVGNAVKEVADAVGEAFEEIGEEVSEEVKKAVQKVADTVEEAEKCVENRGWKLRENFYVRCRKLDCSQSDKQKVREYLNRVHDQFRPEFNEPDLTRTLPCRKIEVETDDGGTETKWGRFYGYNLREEGTGGPIGNCRGGTHGMYVAPTHTAFTCFDGFDSGDVDERRTTRMEYFHSVQFNYAPLSWPNWTSKNPGAKFFPKWIVEGVASAVENPNTTPDEMYRDGNRPLRAIDKPLTEQGDDLPAYKIQDFWTYLVNARNSTPKETFIPLFGERSGVPNKPDLLKAAHLFNLEKHYWGWVRNQGFEAEMTEGFGEALGDTCVPKNGDGSRPDALQSLKTTLTYDPNTRSSPLRRNLRIEQKIFQDAWTAEVAKIEVNNSSSSKPFDVIVSADGNQPVKLYRNRSSENQDCLNRNEGLRESSMQVTVPSDSSQEFYVLMLKSQIADASFDVKVEHIEANGDTQPPTARIVDPSPGEEVHLQGDSLEAEATDPGGANVGDGIARYDWRVTYGGQTRDDLNGNGQPGVDGKTISNAELADETADFDESVKIELTVTDREGDSVTVKETRENISCRVLYMKCSEDSDCCSGTCGAGICVSG